MFAALKAFASKEYKFQQRKSNGPALLVHGASAAGGVCFGLVMMWLQEKLNTTGSPFRRQQKDFLPTTDADVHARNSNTMLQAAGHQLLHGKKGPAEVAKSLGLRPAESDIRPVVRPDGHNLPEVQMPETLVRVAERLRAGEAVAIELDVHGSGQGGGHAVGMYRSRGNHLHFFDPNIGVYQVRDAAGFMNAWIEGCRNGRGWTLSPFRSGTDWLNYYKR